MTSLKQPLSFESLRFGDELDWEPKRLVFPGPWSGHLPFARWIIKACRPNILVELGTHTGNSFSAFCQSIRHFEAPTRAFAVDSWMGDEHAGFYGDDIYNELKGFIDKNYSDFAVLLRSTFDEAVSQFQPKTIDILHIDGLHSYEAVKHDFLTWYDMLSDRAIVLFHDTNVHERGFGVWKLWEELSGHQPAFEFKHSNGLGVLGVGSKLPDMMTNFFESAKDSDAYSDISALFAAKGRPFELNTQVIALNREVSKLANELEASRDYQRELEERLDVVEPAKQELDLILAERDRTLAEIQTEQTRLSNIITELHSSASWRITRPLRIASRVSQYLSKGLGQYVRKAVEEEYPTANTSQAQAQVTLREPSREAAHLSMLGSRLRAFLASGVKLHFPISGDPDLSVILVSDGRVDTAYACLVALRERFVEGDIQAEVFLLKEHASGSSMSDSMVELLAHFKGVRLLEGEAGQAIDSLVKTAAEQANGRHVLVLASEMELVPGSLKSALALLDDDPSVGALGARVINIDGTIASAGSIISQNGIQTDYGVDLRADAGEVMFTRAIDACSAGFLMTPRSLFLRLGGFDEVYAPANLQGADYCIRVWKDNLRVLYLPQAAAHKLHNRIEAIATEEQTRSLNIFRDRHHDWLGSQPMAEASPWFARHHGPRKPALLVITEQVLTDWPSDGRLRQQQIIAELMKHGVHVTLFAVAGDMVNWHKIQRGKFADLEIARAGIDAPDAATFFATRTGMFDAVFVSGSSTMAQIVELLNHSPELKGEARLIYDAEAWFEDKHFLNSRSVGSFPSKVAGKKRSEEQARLGRASDLVLVASENDGAALAGKSVAFEGPCIGTFVASPTVSTFDERQTIIFVGDVSNDESVAAETIHWFIDSVLPELRRLLKRNDLKLTVAGTLNAPSFRKYEDRGLIVIAVEDHDLKALLERARLAIAPVQAVGGGVETVRAIAAHGVPVIAIGRIVEALGWQAGEEILASDDPAQFASHCCELYRDPDLWERLRNGALTRIGKECDPVAFSAVIDRLLALVQQGRR